MAEPWLDCLLQEFFNQVLKSTTQRRIGMEMLFLSFFSSSGRHLAESGRLFHQREESFISKRLCCPQSDTEKLKGLPVTPFMDRDKVSKPSCQTNFIRFVLLPLFTELIKLFPCLEVTPDPPARCSQLFHPAKPVAFSCSNTFWSRCATPWSITPTWSEPARRTRGRPRREEEEAQTRLLFKCSDASEFMFCRHFGSFSFMSTPLDVSF